MTTPITRMPTDQMKRCAEILAAHGRPNLAAALRAAVTQRQSTQEETR